MGWSTWKIILIQLVNGCSMERHILHHWLLALREAVICLMVLAPNVSWGIQKARETFPSLPSTFWRLPLQSRWRYKLHHVLSDSVPLVQFVQVWSDAFLLEARRHKTVEKQKFLLYWNFLSESIWRTTNLNKMPLICKLLKVSTYPNVAFIVRPFKSFLLAHMIIPQPIWKVIWPECSSLHEMQNRFKLGPWQIHCSVLRKKHHCIAKHHCTF